MIDPNDLVLIDIGAGTLPKPQFKTVDLYMPADYKDDICTLKTFKDNSVDWINASHILEHLSDTNVEKAIKSVFRVLRPGGKFTIEVPDFEWVLQSFLDTPEDQRWGWRLQTIYGLQNHEGEYHRTGFTMYRLGQTLKHFGYKNIELWKVNAEESIHNQQVIRSIAHKPIVEGYEYLE